MRRILALAMLCLLVFFGCTGIQYTEQVTAVPLGPEKRSVDSRVLAKADAWKNSGVVVEKGRKYVIKATGRWMAGGA